MRTTFIVRTRRVLPLAVAGVWLLGSSLVWPAAARAAENTPRIDILAVQAQADHLSLIAALHPAPLRTLEPAAVTATSGSIDLAIRAEPVLSGRTAVGVVIDASAPDAAALRQGARSAAAHFLQQLPPQAHTAVIAGQRDTSAALTLALQKLPAWPAAQPVLVLYTDATDAGSETAPQLTARLRAAHAVLAVVSTNPRQQYWTDVAASTGGLVVRARGATSITASDTLAEALRARYEVTFDQLPDPTVPVRLQVASGDQTLVTTLAVPSVDIAARLHSVLAPPRPPHNGSRLWLVAAGALLLSAVLAVVIGILRPGEGTEPVVELGRERDARSW